MTRRDNPVSTYLSDEEKKRLSEWAEETDKSQAHLLREAILEYLDYDRTARIESKLREMDDKLDRVLAQSDGDTTHTHKDRDAVTKGSPAVEKLEEMVKTIRSNHAPVVKDAKLKRVIENYAGIDDRTVRRYKSLMRERGLLLEHPGDPPLWTTDTDQWSNWLNQYGNLNGPDAVEDFLADYPALLNRTADGFVVEMDNVEATE